MQNIRIGNGYDVHPFQEGRKLFLGGVEIPFEKGLGGHSDADVLIHSICDAVLGALCLGDIGVLFPDTDVKYKNTRSLVFLERVRKILETENSKVLNTDSIIIAEKPKVALYTKDMREVISKCLNVEKNAVSVKATTSEGLGFVGRQEGIACFSTVLIVKDNKD